MSASLTVVTLDKPFLFCNIAGVLSYFGMDIHRGQIMTTPEGLVLAVFEFTDAGASWAQHRGAPRQIHRMLEAVVAGSVDMADLFATGAGAADRSIVRQRGSRFTSTTPSRRTRPCSKLSRTMPRDFLYRITRVIAEAGCAVDLALVSTEQGKAIDVLHITRDKRKLTEAEQQALHLALERGPGRPGPAKPAA